jgi:hypothetical protein
MKTATYKELVDVHLQNRIWRNELELALLEIDFWEDLHETNVRPSSATAEESAEIMSQLHHYQRLGQQLLGEVQQQDQEVAEGVRINRILNSPTPDDRKYLREQMDTFRVNFQRFKNDIRQFFVAQAA